MYWDLKTLLLFQNRDEGENKKSFHTRRIFYSHLTNTDVSCKAAHVLLALPQFYSKLLISMKLS